MIQKAQHKYYNDNNKLNITKITTCIFFIVINFAFTYWLFSAMLKFSRPAINLRLPVVLSPRITMVKILGGQFSLTFYFFASYTEPLNFFLQLINNQVD